MKIATRQGVGGRARKTTARSEEQGARRYVYVPESVMLGKK